MFVFNSALVSVLNLITQVIRFVLFIVIASLFGVSWQTDAFFLAQVIPATFINPLIASIQAVYIPTFTQSRIDNSENMGNLVASTLLIMGFGALLIIIVIVTLTPLGLKWFGGSLSPEGINLTYLNTVILSPMVCLQIIGSVVSAAYNSNKDFFIPALTETIRYICTAFLCFVLKPAMGINCLPVSFLLGEVVQFGLLLIFWNRANVKLKFSLNFKLSIIRPIMLGIPLIGGSAVLQLGTTITRFMAAQLPSGSITILDYASRLSVGMMEFLTSGVMLVVLEDWSQAAVNNLNLLAEKLRSSIRVVLFLVSPLTIIFIVLKQPIVEIILLRGNFPPESVFITASVMAIYIASIPIDTFGRFCVRYFLVTKKTNVVGSLAIIRTVVTVILSLILLNFFGVKTFAWAELISITIITVLMAMLINQTNRGVFSGAFFFVLQLLGGVFVCGVVAFVIEAQISFNNPISIILFATTGALFVYLITAWFLRIPEIRQIYLLINARFSKN